MYSMTRPTPPIITMLRIICGAIMTNIKQPWPAINPLYILDTSPWGYPPPHPPDPPPSSAITTYPPYMDDTPNEATSVTYMIFSVGTP